MRAVLAQRRVHVRDAQQPAQRREVGAAEPVRVAGAVGAFVVRRDGRRQRSGQRREPPEQEFGPVLRVALDHPSLVRGQRLGLSEQLRGTTSIPQSMSSAATTGRSGRPAHS